MAEQSYSASTGFLRSAYSNTALTDTQGTTVQNLYNGSYGFTLTSVSIIITSDGIVSPDNAVVLKPFHDPSFDALPAKVTIGTITIPSGVVRGDVITRNFEYDIDPGERIGISLHAPATGTDASGTAFVVIEGFTFPYPADAAGVAKASGDGKVFLVES